MLSNHTVLTLPCYQLNHADPILLSNRPRLASWRTWATMPSSATASTSNCCTQITDCNAPPLFQNGDLRRVFHPAPLQSRIQCKRGLTPFHFETIDFSGTRGVQFKWNGLKPFFQVRVAFSSTPGVCVASVAKQGQARRAVHAHLRQPLLHPHHAGRDLL